MARFEPGSSGIGSDRSANCATTTALKGGISYLDDLEQRPALKLCLSSVLLIGNKLV